MDFTINLTFTFKVLAFLMASLHILDFFEKYLPNFVLSFIRFGRSGLHLKNNFLDVPKRWFTHFYIFSFGLSLILVFFIFDFYGKQSCMANFIVNFTHFLRQGYIVEPTVDATTTFLVMVLMCIQTGRRLYECLFVSVFSNSKMNISVYFMGIWHYFGAIWSIILESPGLCCRDGINLSSDDKIHFSFASLKIYQVIGIIIFVYGFLEEFRSHKILAGLRKKDNKVTTLTHSVPKGGLFNYVSCANYFGEILVYISLSMIMKFSNWSFNWVTIWVLCNQIYSACIAHRWYLATFPDYPKERKALIPFIF